MSRPGASTNRRLATRTKKRVRIDFGLEEIKHSGFTEDISIGGIFIVTNEFQPLGSRLHMRISFAKETFYAEGIVIRHQRVDPALRQVVKNGMGVRFLTPAELVDLLVPSSLRSEGSMSIDCATRDRLERLVREELARGVLFVPVGDPPPAVSQVVEFEIRFAFRSGAAPIRGRGRVVQLLPHGWGENAARPGAVVEVESANSLSNSLQKILV